MIIDGMDAPQSQSGLKLSDRSELQAREDRERKDRKSWYASGSYGIVRYDAHIATCESRETRDLILTMARSYDAMRDILGAAKEKLGLYRAQHSGEYIGGMEYRMLIDAIDAALSLANGSK